MKIAASIISALFVICSPVALHARVPFAISTWKLNVASSKFPGPAPQTEVRSYRLTGNDVLIGVAVTVDTQGRRENSCFRREVGIPGWENDVVYSRYEK